MANEITVLDLIDSELEPSFPVRARACRKTARTKMCCYAQARPASAT
jgi:hypothetical protein